MPYLHDIRVIEKHPGYSGFMGPHAGVAIDCGTCTACCRGPKRMLLVGDIPGAIDGYWPIKPNGDCQYVTDDGCSIYGERPWACRVFDCRDYLQDNLPARVRAAALERI